MSYSDLQTRSQGNTGLKVIEPFGPQVNERGAVGESVRHKADIFSCKETGCILTFRSESEAEKHMDTGKHRRELELVSMYDRIRQMWASKVTGVTFAADVPTTCTSEQCQSNDSAENCNLRPPGWALKVVRRTSKMTEKVNIFLEKKFEEGTRSGHKADPVHLAMEMKVLRNEDRQSLFTPEEWRSSQQISSLFSRMTVVQRQRGLGPKEITEEDIVAAESEIGFVTLRNTVMDDMALPYHPIVVGPNNVCELLISNKLGSLKLADLKEICEKLQLEVNGSSSRKKPIMSQSRPTQNLVHASKSEPHSVYNNGKYGSKKWT